MLRNYDAWLAFLASQRTAPFSWTAPNHCVSFAAASSKALTGKDLLAGFEASFSDEAAARAYLEGLGGIEAVVDKLLTPLPLAHAHRGDIALVVDEAGMTALAVIEGMTLVGPGQAGLRRLPRAMATKAWSITA